MLTRHLERKFGLTPEERSRIAEEEDTDKLDAALNAVLFAASKEDVLKVLE